MTASDSWHPATPVSFPESDYSTVRVEFSHQGGVQFGTATTRSPGEPNFDTGLCEPDSVVTGYFIQANTALDWGWFRVAKADYDMVLARCKAEPASQLYVTYIGNRASVVFRPADFDRSAFKSSDLMEPMDDETAIWLRVLEHTEVQAA